MPSPARLSHRHHPSTTSTASSTSSTSSTRPAIQRLLNFPSNAVNLSRSAAPTSRRVRSHWFTHFVFNWRRSSRTSKFILAATLSFVAIQILATMVVLIFSWEMYCDKPLRIFLTVYILRLFLSCPLTVYLHLAPRRRQAINNLQSRAELGEVYPMAERPPTVVQPQRPPIPTSTASIAHTQTNPDLYSDTVLTSWVDKAKSALDLFSFLWFIIGNYLLFTSTTCYETAAPLYYLSLIVIIIGYIFLSVPVLLCTSVIFCLPCVLVGMRLLHVDDAVDMGGASSEEIAKIPVYQFKSNKATAPAAAAVALAAHAAAPAKKSDPEPGIMDRLWIQLGVIDPPGRLREELVYDTLEIPNEQDQVCAICLSTYDDGDILCQLWCNHHFHKSCVHEWLVLNSKCPMCKRDCRGKDHTISG